MSAWAWLWRLVAVPSVEYSRIGCPFPLSLWGYKNENSDQLPNKKYGGLTRVFNSVKHCTIQRYKCPLDIRKKKLFACVSAKRHATTCNKRREKRWVMACCCCATRASFYVSFISFSMRMLPTPSVFYSLGGEEQQDLMGTSSTNYKDRT